jgi:hypothetical protein
LLSVRSTVAAPAVRPFSAPRRITAAGAALAAILLLGAALRLIWPGDIEYKPDEAWIFLHARALLDGSPWPWTGMSMSIGPAFPGMSLWVFGALAWLGGAATPPDLARDVQLSNVAALALFVLFALVSIPRRAREPWYWAAALWAVNPVAILLERKIWLPSVLPLPAVLLYSAWWHRRHPAAAFLWGALGALMAQIHVAVALLQASLVVWTWLWDRRAAAWKAWLAGSVAGALPALPWLVQFAGHAGAEAGRLRWPTATYFLKWVTQPFGFGLNYPLTDSHVAWFLRGPMLFGAPTYLMGLLHVALGLLLAVLLARAARATLAVGERPSLRPIVVGLEPAGVLVNAGLWGYGALLTLLTIGRLDASRHYMVVVMPLMALWAARLAFVGGRVPAGASPGRPPSAVMPRALLGIAVICLALSSAGLRAYIHEHPIICDGAGQKFGQTWASQQVLPGACHFHRTG